MKRHGGYHKENTSKRGDIWTYEENEPSILHTKNDRIIHKWQTYAGSYNEKTIDKHLAAIRCFEVLLEGKRFLDLTTDDFAAFRDELKRRSNIDVEDNMSASSIYALTPFFLPHFLAHCVLTPWYLFGSNT